MELLEIRSSFLTDRNTNITVARTNTRPKSTVSTSSGNRPRLQAPCLAVTRESRQKHNTGKRLDDDAYPGSSISRKSTQRC